MLLIDIANAGRVAELDVEIETGAAVLAGNVPVTGQVRKDFAQQVQRLVHGPDRGVWPKIAGTVPRHAPGHRHFWKRFAPMDFDIGIPFVVLEADIVMGLVLLDEGRFQQ